jgi:hypothetical protein
MQTVRVDITIHGVLPEDPNQPEQSMSCGLTVATNGTGAQAYIPNGAHSFFLIFTTTIAPESAGPATWTLECINLYMRSTGPRSTNGSVVVT